MLLKKSKIKLITSLNESICEIELNDKILGKELRNENIASRASELAKEVEIRNAIIKIQRDAYDSEKGLINNIKEPNLNKQKTGKNKE